MSGLLTCISTSVVDGFCEVDDVDTAVVPVVDAAVTVLLPLPALLALGLLDGCIVEFDIESCTK